MTPSEMGGRAAVGATTYVHNQSNARMMGALMRSWWCWLNEEPARSNKRKRKEAVMKEVVLRRWQIVAKTDIERGASKIGKGDAEVRSFLTVMG